MSKFIALICGGEVADMTPFENSGVIVEFQNLEILESLDKHDSRVIAFVQQTPNHEECRELCSRLRNIQSDIDIIITIVLECDDVLSRQRALLAGADDYVEGPIERGMVLDRILSTHATAFTEPAKKLVQAGDFLLELSKMKATWNGSSLSLRPAEFQLLRCFVESPGRVLTRKQLIDALGRHEFPNHGRLIDLRVRRLRQSLKEACASSVSVRTVRSLGYVLDIA